jgi:Flp pilus assembly protein TadG
MKIQRFSKRDGEKGQSFVELGLSLVFLLILVAAVIDLGWAFFTVIALRDAAQEAATVGSICPTDNNKIMERLYGSASAPLDMTKLSTSQIDISIINPSDPGAAAAIALGNSVQVTVTYEHEIVTPFVGSFIGTQKYPLTVTVADTILRLDCTAIQ